MTSLESPTKMVQVETRERIISRTLTNGDDSSRAESQHGDDNNSAAAAATASIEKKKKKLELISYQMTPKPPPEPLPFPLNILSMCFSGNMKYLLFPLLLAFSLGLFLAFSKAVSSTHGMRGYQPQNHRLSEDDPNYMPPEHVMFGNLMQDHGLGLPRRGAHCDCSLCELDDGVSGFQEDPNTHKRLLKYSINHFYGNAELANHIEAFIPRRKKQWALDNSLYLSASKVCASSPRPLAVVLCPTVHANLAKRQAIRETWGKVAKGFNWPNKRLPGEIKLVFLLGVSDSDDDNNVIAQESDKYGDLVLSDFPESPPNLSRKILSGFKWVINACPGAHYIVKVQEDIFLDVPLLMNVLAAQENNAFIWGQFVHELKVKRGDDKNAVTKAVYSPEWYPPHVKGTIYAMPKSLAKGILQIAEHFPYLPEEDVFITGILAKVFDARHIGIPSSLVGSKSSEDTNLCEFAIGKLLVARKVSPKLSRRYWKRIENSTLCDTKAAVETTDKLILE